MKRRTLLQLVLSGAVAGPIAGVGTAQAAQSSAGQADPLKRGIPRFSGSFLQPWLVDPWTSQQWQTEFEAMREVGIDTLILQWTADSGEQTTIYPSGLPGYTQNTAHDLVGETLRWADRYGIHVYLGLNEDADWWSKYALDRAWFLDRIGVGRDLVTDMWQRYSTHASLAGWYIALEPWNSTTNPDMLPTLGDGYSLVTGRAHSLTHRPVMIAPFYNVAFGQTPAQWSDTWAALLRRAPLDIIALQDGVGAAHATTADLPTWFAATLQAIREGRPATRLWSDTETYLIANYKTMPVNDFVADIQAVAPYVEAFTSFSFNHYLSPQQVNPAYYATYRAYALTGQLDRMPPSTPTGLVLSPLGSGGVHLSWSPAHDNRGVVAYDVYRNGALLTRVYDTTSYDDAAGGAGERYQVASVDAAGNTSPASGSVVAAGPVAGRAH